MINIYIKNAFRKCTASWVTIAFAWMAMGIISPGQLNAGTAKTENSASTVEAAKSENIENNSFEKEGTTPEIAKKKKFPWLWVAAGVVVAGVIVYFTLIKKPKYDLLVETETGVTGIPSVGKYTYKKGKQIAYSFTCIDGYKNLTVLLDGNPVTQSGTILMDKAHSLKATAAQMPDFSLVVKTIEGVTGSPAAGTYSYREGTTIHYHYTVATDYNDLTVLLDGKTVTSSGTIIMDQSHTLEATATKMGEFTLVVKTDAGITGFPPAGTYRYEKGASVSYQYTAAEGMPFAKLDGNPVLPSGSLKIYANHELKITKGPIPDIRGKWRIVLSNYPASKYFSVLFSGTQTSGTFEVLEDLTYDFWPGEKGEYTVSSIQVVMEIGDHPVWFYFYGNFLSSTDIQGVYEWDEEPPYGDGGGTWTATRIK